MREAQRSLSRLNLKAAALPLFRGGIRKILKKFERECRILLILLTLRVVN
jgi:hypothetical protein